MTRKAEIFGLFFLGLALVLVGCKNKSQPKPTESALSTEQQQDQHIEVQHILIGFKGTLPGKDVKRSQADAEKLAKEVLAKAKSGTDFDGLVKEYTDDRAPGIYAMSNRGATPQGEEFPRDQMVPAFGDVGFVLKVGEIGLAEFDKAKSPFGYHIIKRVK